MAQPLTDAINALTTYANTVTGKTPPDTTLSDAVATLASGYGGSLPNMGARDTYNLSELFYALAYNEYTTGTVAVTEYFPTDTDTLFCDTGWSGILGGIVIFDLQETGNSYNYKNLAEGIGFFLINNSAVTKQTETSRGVWRTGNSQGTKLLQSSVMNDYYVLDGKLYIRPKYTSPSSGVLFVPTHTYRWIAWKGYQ